MVNANLLLSYNGSCLLLISRFIVNISKCQICEKLSPRIYRYCEIKEMLKYSSVLRYLSPITIMVYFICWFWFIFQLNKLVILFTVCKFFALLYFCYTSVNASDRSIISILNIYLYFCLSKYWVFLTSKLCSIFFMISIFSIEATKKYPAYM